MKTTITTTLGTMTLETACSAALENHFNNLIKNNFYMGCNIFRKTPQYVQFGSLSNNELGDSGYQLELTEEDLILHQPVALKDVGEFMDIAEPGAVFFVRHQHFNRVGSQIVIMLELSDIDTFNNVVYLGKITEGLEILDKFKKIKTSLDCRILDEIKINSITSDKAGIDEIMLKKFSVSNDYPTLSPTLVELYERFLDERTPASAERLYKEALNEKVNIFLPAYVDLMIRKGQAQQAFLKIREMYPEDSIDRIVDGTIKNVDGIYGNNFCSYVIKHGAKWVTYDQTGYCEYLSLRNSLTPDRDSYKQLMFSELKRLYELHLYSVDTTYSYDVNDFNKDSKDFFKK